MLLVGDVGLRVERQVVHELLQLPAPGDEALELVGLGPHDDLAGLAAHHLLE